MVEGSYTSGRNIRVVAQVQPAVIAQLDTDSAVDVRIAINPLKKPCIVLLPRSTC
jgi:hypothetical protein